MVESVMGSISHMEKRTSKVSFVFDDSLSLDVDLG
jgi:hypothetical protein